MCGSFPAQLLCWLELKVEIFPLESSAQGRCPYPGGQQPFYSEMLGNLSSLWGGAPAWVIWRMGYDTSWWRNKQKKIIWTQSFHLYHQNPLFVHGLQEQIVAKLQILKLVLYSSCSWAVPHGNCLVFLEAGRWRGRAKASETKIPNCAGTQTFAQGAAENTCRTTRASCLLISPRVPPV